MSDLTVSGVHAAVNGHEILRGVDLRVGSGEVHALMGPNGSGKSTLAHVLMGRGDYEVTAGSVTLDGQELLGLPTWRRSRAGLFLAMQYPTEVPGVGLEDFLAATTGNAGNGGGELSARITEEAGRLGVPDEFLTRGVNVEFSGGEKKRNETLQLAVLRPKIAVLDEIDSGLDIDALRDISRRVEAMTHENGLGVLAITHYARLLTELRPDRVHILMAGRIVASGGPELADQLEGSGYDGLGSELGIDELAVDGPVPRSTDEDPFGDPTAGALPFET